MEDGEGGADTTTIQSAPIDLRMRGRDRVRNSRRKLWHVFFSFLVDYRFGQKGQKGDRRDQRETSLERKGRGTGGNVRGDRIGMGAFGWGRSQLSSAQWHGKVPRKAWAGGGTS